MPLPKDGDLRQEICALAGGSFSSNCRIANIVFVNWQFPLTALPGACSGGEIDGSHLFIPDSCNNHLI